MKAEAIVALLMVVSLGACTWVKTTEEGAQIQLLDVATSNCQHLGLVTTSVKDQIGPFDRDEARVSEELIALAKNRAAVLGGNSMVMSRPPLDGEAGFDIYSCA